MAVLSIFLTILKIIGIMLLVILGIVLAVLLVILFVPIRYKVKAHRLGGEDDPPIDAKADVTWLLHLVHVMVRYPADKPVRVKLFGITIMVIPKPELTPEAQKKQEEKARKKAEKQVKKAEKQAEKERLKAEKESGKAQEASAQSSSISFDAETEAQKEDGSTTIAQASTNADAEAVSTVEQFAEDSTDDGLEESENASLDNAAISLEEDTSEGQDDSVPDQNGEDVLLQPDDTQSSAKENEEKQNPIQKTLYKIQAIYDKIKTGYEGIINKSRETTDKINYYLELVQSEMFQSAFAQCKKQLGNIVKHIAPRKFKVDFRIGMSDPYTTGLILSLYSTVYPWICKNVRIVGEFEQEIICGDIYIKGKIRVVNLLIAALRVFFDKNIRKLIKLFKKGGNKNG